MSDANDEELPPSKLGTKSHWDEVYEREVRVFRDVGDEGEIWFGEGSVKKMRTWAQKHLPPPPKPLRILECGCGNGTLLLSFLTSKPASSLASSSSSPTPLDPQLLHLTGIDYSPLSLVLAQEVEDTRREAIIDEIDEEEGEVINDVTTDWRAADLLRHNFEGEVWDLVMDKGTFDALCLSDEVVEEEGGRLPSRVYPEKVSKLVKEGGFFLITSCNFTEEEIKARWTVDGLGFKYHSSVPHQSYTFGGKSGTVVCTVAFQKVTTARRRSADGIPVTSVDTPALPKGRHSSPPTALYICVDCGGTKTAIAIASEKDGIIARADGGTGNMAEVGVQLSYDVITATTLKAIYSLPDEYKVASSSGQPNGHIVCPARFADVWVGISGCDTPYDSERMAERLSPFFGRSDIAVINDAHLLGGALLTNHCQWGIAVIAGTGSVIIALEVDEHGRVQQIGRRGGAGYLLGDDGSAFDLGRNAIRFAIDDHDAGSEVRDGLADRIKDHFGVKHTSEVFAKVYDLDPQLPASDATNLRKIRIASLSYPILSSFSSTVPDPLAERVVHTSATSLVSSITSLVAQMAKRGKRLEDAAIIMGGGVIKQEPYTRVVLELLAEQGVKFGVEEVVRDVVGEGVRGLVEKARSKRSA